MIFRRRVISPEVNHYICLSRRFLNLMVLLMIVLFTSCEERYWPDLGDKYQSLLVVEGKITSDPGPYIIHLSTTTSIYDPIYEPLTGYEVIVNDNLGNTETLEEDEPGYYKTAENGIQGVVGRAYRITIHSPDEKTYQSNFEELKSAVGIDTVFVDLEYRESTTSGSDIPGYQFFLNSNPATEDSSYFLWQMQRTFEFQADFLIYYWYDGELHLFPDTDSLQTCWTTGRVFQIFTESTVGLSDPGLNRFPLHYVPFDNREFSVRYSLLIHQYTISEQAQEYWMNVNEQNSSGGELYTKMPFQVRGNIVNINDPNEPVLGYFHAAGVDTKRIFFNRPGYPVEMCYPECELREPDYMEYGFMFYGNTPRDYPRYVTMNASGARAVPSPVCVDCRESGGTIVKPEFWID